MLNQEYRSLLSSLSGRRVVVLGDLIADEYIFGNAERISREAPVLILKWQDRYVALGGATNTAHNICALGGHVELLGILGSDPLGRELRRTLQLAGIGQEHILIDPTRPTTAKTRILAGGEQAVKQQLVRIDKLSQAPLSQTLEKAILEKLTLLLPKADGLLISDYGLGVVTERIKKVAIALANRHQLPVSVDSRYKILSYRGASIVTPNLEEAGEALGMDLTTSGDIVIAAKKILTTLGSQAVLITRGEDGMTLLLADGSTCHLPALNPTKVYDVTGAGDTVIGTLTLCLAAGASYFQGAVLANIAAGLVVRKLGTATITAKELEEALTEN
jgi:rfaE bifunctional protein kinase chain/domain